MLTATATLPLSTQLVVNTLRADIYGAAYGRSAHPIPTGIFKPETSKGTGEAAIFWYSVQRITIEKKSNDSARFSVLAACRIRTQGSLLQARPVCLLSCLINLRLSKVFNDL
jgi:hypothetical protein